MIQRRLPDRSSHLSALEIEAGDRIGAAGEEETASKRRKRKRRYQERGKKIPSHEANGLQNRARGMGGGVGIGSANSADPRMNSVLTFFLHVE